MIWRSARQRHDSLNPLFEVQQHHNFAESASENGATQRNLPPVILEWFRPTVVAYEYIHPTPCAAYTLQPGEEVAGVGPTACSAFYRKEQFRHPTPLRRGFTTIDWTHREFAREQQSIILSIYQHTVMTPPHPPPASNPLPPQHRQNKMQRSRRCPAVLFSERIQCGMVLRRCLSFSKETVVKTQMFQDKVKSALRPPSPPSLRRKRVK